MTWPGRLGRTLVSVLREMEPLEGFVPGVEWQDLISLWLSHELRRWWWEELDALTVWKEASVAEPKVGQGVRHARRKAASRGEARSFPSKCMEKTLQGLGRRAT